VISYSRRALITGLAAALLAPRHARAASVTDGAGRTVLVPARVERVFPAGPVRDLSLCAKHLFFAARAAIVRADAQGRGMKACSANKFSLGARPFGIGAWAAVHLSGGKSRLRGPLKPGGRSNGQPSLGSSPSWPCLASRHWPQRTNLWRKRATLGTGSKRLRGGTRIRCRLEPSRAFIMNESIDLLPCHFGLTPAEARLALHLVAGETLRSAAVKLSITYETARSQLKNIFKKTGTCRQAELVIVILTALPGCVGAPGGLAQRSKSLA
jgi:DNA-binding CsgD family transcriptional regulator